MLRYLCLLLLPLAILALPGCAATPTGTARFDEKMLDPDHPPFPATPPPGLADTASLADVNKVIQQLRRQSQYSQAVLRDYPGDVKAQRVKAFTDDALPAYQAVRQQIIERQYRDGRIKIGS